MVKFGGRPQFRLALSLSRLLSSVPSVNGGFSVPVQVVDLCCTARRPEAVVVLMSVSEHVRGGEGRWSPGVESRRSGEIGQLCEERGGRQSVKIIFLSYSDLGLVSPLHSYFWTGWNWWGQSPRSPLSCRAGRMDFIFTLSSSEKERPRARQ